MPAVAKSYGIPAVWIGYQFSLVAAFMAGSLLFTNGGKMLAPLAFAAVQAHTGSYSIAFGLVGVLGVVEVIALTAARRGSSPEHAPAQLVQPSARK